MDTKNVISFILYRAKVKALYDQLPDRSDYMDWEDCEQEVHSSYYKGRTVQECLSWLLI